MNLNILSLSDEKVTPIRKTDEVKAEKTTPGSSCCSTNKQATCCAPVEKASCCGTSGSTSCGCQ